MSKQQNLVSRTKLEKASPSGGNFQVSSGPRDKQKKSVRKAMRRKNRSSGVQMSYASKYLRTLSDPFNAGPLPMGFGTMIPTTTLSLFARSAPVPSATSTCMIITMQASMSFPIKTYQNAADNLQLSVMSMNGYGWRNSTHAMSEAQVARIVSGGLRVRVRTAATNIAGRVFSGFCNADSYNNLTSMTPANICQLYGVDRVDPVNGEIRAESDYRPRDNASYEFISSFVDASGVPPENLQPIHFIALIGFVPGSFAIDYDAILHLETAGGFDTTASDSYSGDSSFTMDDAFRSAKKAGANVGTFIDDTVGIFRTLHNAYTTLSSQPFSASSSSAVPRERAGSYVQVDEQKAPTAHYEYHRPTELRSVASLLSPRHHS